MVDQFQLAKTVEIMHKANIQKIQITFYYALQTF